MKPRRFASATMASMDTVGPAVSADIRRCSQPPRRGAVKTGATAEDTEGLVDYARCIDGVEVGALIELRADGSVKTLYFTSTFAADGSDNGFGGGPNGGPHGPQGPIGQPPVTTTASGN